jgi:hypothetical protein
MNLFMSAMYMVIFVLCSFIAYTSEIPTASALWGFSAGVWFTTSLKYFFDWKYS